MNAAMNQTAAHTNRTTNRTGRGHLVTMIILVGLVGAIVACAAHQTTNAASATAESLFADAVRPESARLKSAREAARRGDRELAIHDYFASIQEDTSTAEPAIAEVVKVFLSGAEAHGAGGRYVDESAQINRCYQALVQLKQADAATRGLPEAARAKLFKEISHVRSVGNERAKAHIIVADGLRREAKGWNDDENKQAEALHKVNLAWSYYPASTDEWMVSKMYEIWADMKGELPTWQYNQVMERDRLQLGRVVGDRS